MRDVWSALALVPMIEGALCALFPDGMKRAAARAVMVPSQALRLAGLTAACLDVVLYLAGASLRAPALTLPAVKIAGSVILP